MRVFVNDKAVDVPRGARVRDAVAQADDGLARLLDNAAYVTDAAGRPIDAGDAVGEAGSVYRVVVSARREARPSALMRFDNRSGSAVLMIFDERMRARRLAG